MKRGDFYRVKKPSGRDPKSFRVFCIVSRQTLIDSRFPTVICAPVHTQRHGLATQINVGAVEGLKHDSAILCDGLISVPKKALTNFVGALGAERLRALDASLAVALGLV